MATEADYRLPRNVVPSHYTLEIEPDLDTFTFKAKVTIEADVVEATSTVTLNSIGLDRYFKLSVHSSSTYFSFALPPFGVTSLLWFGFTGRLAQRHY